MFEDENEEDWLTPDFRKQLAHFEQMYDRKDYSYIDSDHIEFILDHLIALNQIKKARWAAEKALEHFPTNSTILIRYAQVLSFSGDINRALKILLELEQVEVNNVEVLLSIANCYSQFRKPKSAIKYYKRAFDLSSGDEKVDIAIDLAMEYENSEEYHLAIEVLKEAKKKGTPNDLLVFEMAHCYEKLSDYDNAVKAYLEYIDEEPYSYTTWYNLGNTYAKQDKFNEAIWAYEYAVIINDSFVPAFYNLANTYLDSNQVKKALEYFQLCLELDQEDPLVYCSIGECYEELEEIEKAYEMFDKSTELLPQFGEAWLGKGIMSNHLGFHQRAIRELMLAVELEPINGEYWNALGNAYESANQDDLALNAYQKSIEYNPDTKEFMVDYLTALSNVSADLFFDYIEKNKKVTNNNVIKLVLVYVSWMMGEKLNSFLYFNELLEEEITLAKNIFYYFPELEDELYFTEKLKEVDKNNRNEKF